MANKYRARRTTRGGRTYDSAKEARRAGELRILERAGVIRNLREQVRYELQGANGPIRYRSGRVAVYVADFVYEDRDHGWATVIEDVKGMDTPLSKLKRAIMEAQGFCVLLK